MKARGVGSIPSEYRRTIEHVSGRSPSRHIPVGPDLVLDAIARLIGKGFAMRLASQLRRISLPLKPWLSALWDALPPYRYFEGTLGGKEMGAGGKRYIVVDSKRVEVDSVTFDLLDVGETIRLRYTRADRAINIDRFPETQG